MKMTLSNGTKIQLDLLPGATVTITKTVDGEKLELDGVKLSSDPSVVYQAVGWVGAPKPKYTWKHTHADGLPLDIYLEVDGELVGVIEKDHWNVWQNAGGSEFRARSTANLGAFDTLEEAQAAAIAAWEAHNAQ